MKNTTLTICLLLVGLTACKAKKATVDHPPGISPLKQSPSYEVPDKFHGDWSRCDVVKGKSLFTRVNLSGSLEVRTTTYNDEYCQLIESTRERTVVTNYSVEYKEGRLEAKVQQRRLVVYDKHEVAVMNEGNVCGHNSWKAGKPKDVLGENCPGLPRDNKFDLSMMSVLLSGKSLVLDKVKFDKHVEKKVGDLGKVTVLNETTSSVEAEPESVGVMLVYPPQTEILRVELPETQHSNLAFCPSVLSARQASLRAVEKITKMKAELNKEEIALGNIKNKIAETVAEQREYIEAQGLQEYDALTSDRDSVQEQVEAAEADYQACESDCDQIWSRMKALRETRWELNNKINRYRISRSQYKTYYRYVNAITYAEREYEEQRTYIGEKAQEISVAEAKLLATFDELDRKESVPARMAFTGSWTKNLKALIKANPKLKFRLADLGTVVMTYRMLGIPEYPASNSLLSFPGQQTSSRVSGRVNFKSYPMAMNGEMALSLIAACPALDPEAFDYKQKEPRVIEFEANFTYKK